MSGAIDAGERAAGRAALALLLARQSPWPMVEPAPSDDELALILAAALRAPDHGALQPWRLVVIRGAGRDALGDVLVAAGARREPDADAERFRAKAFAAPMLIALAAHVNTGHKVPESEQVLAVGAAAMNMLDAIHLLGYGGFWATGKNSHDAHVHAALGFTEAERLLGFLYVGTPATPPKPVERHAPAGFAREWPSGNALP